MSASIPRLLQHVDKNFRDFERTRYARDLESYFRSAGEFHVHFGVRRAEGGYHSVDESPVIRTCVQITRKRGDDFAVECDPSASHCESDFTGLDGQSYGWAVDAVRDGQEPMVLVGEVEGMKLAEPRGSNRRPGRAA